MQRKYMKCNGNAYEVEPIWNQKSQSETGVGWNDTAQNFRCDWGSSNTKKPLTK